MPYTLSPEQNIVAKSLLGDKSSDIKYFDLDTAFSSVYYAILSAIEDNKKILLHVPSHINLSGSIDKLIKSYRLDNLTINVGSAETIPESDIITLRSVLKKGVDTAPIIDHIISSENLRTELNSVSSYYHAMDKKILSDRSFRELTSTLIYQQKETTDRNERLELTEQKLSFTTEEYQEIKKVINIASSLYAKEYDLLDNLNLLSDNVWTKSPEELTELRKKLDLILNENSQLKADYNKTYNTLSSNATEELNSQLLSLQKTIQSYHLECTSYHINSIYAVGKSESKFSLFTKKEALPNNAVYVKAFDTISGMIKDISSDWFDTIAEPTAEEISYEFIIDFLNSVNENIPKHRQILKQNLSSSIHRINSINTNSNSVKELNTRLTNHIARIDDLGFIRKRFNGNTLSFIKQMELNVKISNVLSQCHNLIGNDSGYINWKTFANKNNILIHNIISELKRFPTSSWSQLFENWYNERIKSSILSNSTIDSTKISSLNKLNHKILNNEVISITNKIQINRIKASDLLKSNAKDIYNTLFKKKTLNPISWKEISIKSRSFSQEFFPIHIDQDLNNAGQYDLVISFDKRKDTLNERSKMHHLSPIAAGDIENRAKSNDLFLFLNSYQYTEPLSELPKTEKLKASKKLAKFILSLNQQVKIYQIKSGNIISLLPINDDVYFEQKMDKYGIKSIDTSSTLYDKLTESILFTNRQPFLLIKDELINPNLHQYLLWQAALLNTFRSAGYKIISLNTSDQLNNNNVAFDNLINKMIDSNEKTASSKSVPSVPRLENITTNE